MRRACTIAVLRAVGKIPKLRQEFVIDVVTLETIWKQDLSSLVRIGSRAQEEDFILLTTSHFLTLY